MKLNTLALVVFFSLISAPISHAAQDVTVSVDEAAIREQPDAEARILESKTMGSKIRTSSTSKNGWYKVKSASGKYGWIWQSDVTPLEFKPEFEKASLETTEKSHEKRGSEKDPWLFLKIGGNLFGLISSQISVKMGVSQNQMYWAYGGFGEVQFRVQENLRLAFRLSSYTNLTSITLNEINYQLAFTGTPLLVGLDADLIKGARIDFAGGVYAGYAFNNTVTLKALNFEDPNGFSISSSNFAFLVNFSTKYWFNEHLSALADLGFYYTRIASTRVTENGFYGDAPFRDADGFSVLTFNHLGPLLGLGLQYAF